MSFENLVVLIVEDHPGVRDSMERAVEHWPDVDVLSVESFLSAAILINIADRIDLLMSNVFLIDDMTGVDIAELAVEKYPDIAVMLFSTDEACNIARLTDHYLFVRKPFGRDEIARHVHKAFANLRPMVGQLCR